MNELDNAILVLQAAVVALDTAVKNSGGGMTGNQILRLVEAGAQLTSVNNEVFEEYANKFSRASRALREETLK